MSQKSLNPVFLIIISLLISLALGGIVGGIFAFKNKKTKERAEQPLQAQKTREQKIKATGQQNDKVAKKQEEVKPVKVKDWQTYENKEYKYKIKYPKGWYISQEGPWLVNFTSYDPKNVKDEEAPGVKIEILVQGNPRNLNLKDWTEEGHQFLGSPKTTKEMKISELDGIWEELDFFGPTVNVTIMRANDVFTVSYTGKIPDYEANKNIFNKIVEGMEIEK